MLLSPSSASSSLQQGAGLGTDEGPYGFSAKGEAFDCARAGLEFFYNWFPCIRRLLHVQSFTCITLVHVLYVYPPSVVITNSPSPSPSLPVVWPFREHDSQVKCILLGGLAQVGQGRGRTLSGDSHSVTAKTIRHLRQEIRIQHIVILHNLSCMSLNVAHSDSSYLFIPYWMYIILVCL